MANNHYIPRLILRNFTTPNNILECGREINYLKKHSEKISIFNVKTNEIHLNEKIENIYCEKDLYDSELEKKFNLRLESQFGNFFNNIIKMKESEIILKRHEIMLIKKFLIISILRVKNCSDSIRYNKDRRKNIDIDKEILFAAARGIKLTREEIECFLKKDKNKLDGMYNEKVIEGETDVEYWYRTLNVILDTDGSSEQIKNHKYVTSTAIRWSKVVEAGYLAFWDSYEKNDFVITDVGMTSENEKTFNEVVYNFQKTNQLNEIALNLNDNKVVNPPRNFLFETNKQLYFNHNFHENFMMFPISSKRMIVLISPYFKFLEGFREHYKFTADYSSLTYITDTSIFQPNTNRYVNVDGHMQPTSFHEDDEYIYKIQNLNRKDTLYCNCLFLDRIETFLGFSHLFDLASSVLSYKKRTKKWKYAKVNYETLEKIIKESIK